MYSFRKLWIYLDQDRKWASGASFLDSGWNGAALLRSIAHGLYVLIYETLNKLFRS